MAVRDGIEGTKLVTLNLRGPRTPFPKFVEIAGWAVSAIVGGLILKYTSNTSATRRLGIDNQPVEVEYQGTQSHRGAPILPADHGCCPEVGKGFTSLTPLAAKSSTLRVASVRECVRAVAAIRLSRTGWHGDVPVLHRTGEQQVYQSVVLWRSVQSQAVHAGAVAFDFELAAGLDAIPAAILGRQHDLTH
ncbi:MAG: hypothetical protein OXH96_02485 [Spirochaetaceae bacterium]|nr:hypothetical protein [Spirochaetaceae bacterium]